MTNHNHEWWQQLWWSRSCVLCRARSGRELLCTSCQTELQHSQASCDVCALPTGPHNYCTDCAQFDFAFDQVVAATLYEAEAQQLLQRFKYRANRSVGKALSQLLLNSILMADYATWPEAIIPVPCSNRRRWWRGFNVPDDISFDLSRTLKLPIYQPFITRHQPLSQVTLNRQQRLQAVQQRHALQRQAPAKFYVLVDDVMTTGATASYLAGLLKQQGAERVDVWVLARTPVKL